MTDKARRVLLDIFNSAKNGDEICCIVSPSGTHMLVPVEVWERVVDHQELFTHEAVDAFWKVWNEIGEPHKHGVYESTWAAFRRALAEIGGEDE